ncbi:Esterase [Pseudocercospora fuligena]|uniref:Esterase n=1 Tax=Pseudocercospora fuligena TaxID=685502 RepID=A0A8H6RPH3_9PEZI|nr:Esterase [Pseudocercospora fuligena]
MGLVSWQPAKAIWTLFAIVINAARLPIWMIWYLPVSMRPHPAWSYKQSIMVQIVKSFLWNASMVQVKTPLSLKPLVERQKWKVAQPASSTTYMGPANADPKIKPEALGGTWYPTPPPQGGLNKPKIAVIHFHGGAYVIGDGRTKDAGFAAKTLIEQTEATHVYAPQYRLSSNPGCQFPAALQDAITAYAYVVQVENIAPSKIVLSGDSAGANLALALTRYLTEYGSSIGLGLPLATWLWSPWVSPMGSLTSESFDSSPNQPTDYITSSFGGWGAHTYQPRKETGITLDHPYISFESQHVFSTPIPIYISTGECEVLYHDDVRLAEAMASIKGNDVTLQVEEHSVHDTILAGPLVGFEEEAIQAAKRAGDWLKGIDKTAKL